MSNGIPCARRPGCPRARRKIFRPAQHLEPQRRPFLRAVGVDRNPLAHLLSVATPKSLGTIHKYARQSTEDRMSTKSQEVAFDRVLVDRFKSGDASAFDEMVSRYWDRIYSMVHQLLRNSEDAEEVTQDAFIRAHRGLANFRGESAFSTWLFQI